MIFLFSPQASKEYQHPDNYKQNLTCKSTAFVSTPGISGFFPSQDSSDSQNLSKMIHKIDCNLLCCSARYILLLRIVFLYTTHGMQNILLAHVLVCRFTVLVLVLELTVLLPLVAGSRMRKAERRRQCVVEAGHGQLMRVKPAGVTLKSSAEVAEGVIQVSVRAKRGVLRDWETLYLAVYFRGLRREGMSLAIIASCSAEREMSRIIKNSLRSTMCLTLVLGVDGACCLHIKNCLRAWQLTI